MVSGDRDLLDLKHPGIDVRTAAAAIDALDCVHPWHPQLTLGVAAEQILQQSEAEGHGAVLRTARAFVSCGSLNRRDRARALRHLVTPESLDAWHKDLTPELVADLQSRGWASRAAYPRENVAYVRLPPDPGTAVKAGGDVPLPTSTLITELSRRTDLPTRDDFAGWRVHALGQASEFPPEGRDDT